MSAGREKSGEQAKVSHKPTPEEIVQIVDYLASPAGERVMREISDKHDDYRVKLNIPEPGGTFKVKMPAGAVRQVVGLEQISTPDPGIDSPIDLPQSCQLTKRLIAEHPEFLTQTGKLPVIDIQDWADEFHQFHPNDIYDAILTFPNVAPLGQSWVMEFRSPVELREFEFDRAAVIFTAQPTGPDVEVWARLQIVPAWAMTAAIIYVRKNEIHWLPAHLVYYVGRSGQLMVPAGEAFCSPIKMYPETQDAEIQYWTGFRDWFLAPCLHALSRMNGSPRKPADFNPKG